MTDKMPEKSIEWLESECVKRLQRHPETRGTTYVKIVRLNPAGSGPNWTFALIEPTPTILGWPIAVREIAELAGTFALAAN